MGGSSRRDTSGDGARGPGSWLGQLGRQSYHQQKKESLEEEGAGPVSAPDPVVYPSGGASWCRGLGGRWGMGKGALQRPGRGLQNPADDGRVRTIQGHQDAGRVDNKTDTGFSYKVLTLMGTLSGESQAVGMHGKRQQANSNLSKVRR